MCGITGFWQREGFQASSASAIAERMARMLAHRGPDGSGVWQDDSVGLALAHRRLAVVDLSPAGHQPMISRCGRFVLVFNGEIYNHLEIRARLRSAGHHMVWRGHSDTETFLECISVWGIQLALNAAVGMYAFALWNRTERCLILSRDRMGEKPLYYGWQGDCFLFGSELKALKAHPAFAAEIDRTASELLLRQSYIPSPYSIYRGIRKLPAGSYLTLTSDAVSAKAYPQPTTYWDLREIAEAGARHPFRGSFDDATDQLEALLRNGIRNQMLADVPLGAFLSGGVDSSLVVALMQASSAAKVKTFCVGMPDARIDETIYANVVAKYLGTEHTNYTITSNDALEIIPRIPEIWDEPFADSSQIPTWLVCQDARKDVTVVLTGDGGDESFFGYQHYSSLRMAWRWRFLSRLPLERLGDLARVVAGENSRTFSRRRLHSIKIALSARTPEAMIDAYLDRFRGEPLPLVESIERHEHANWAAPIGLTSIAAIAAWKDAYQYLPDDIMVKCDRASMNVSLEMRAPLLDHRVVEFAWSLPVEYKLKGAQTKSVLRKVLFKHIPASLFTRKKQGFSIPVASWLRNELLDWTESLLNAQALSSNGFDSKLVHQSWDEHKAGRRDNSERLWAILMLRSFQERNNGG